MYNLLNGMLLGATTGAIKASGASALIGCAARLFASFLG